MTRVVFGAVTVELGGRRVVDGVDLDVRTGEWVGLIGPNGAGKTTLLRALAGLVPYTGSILVGGDEPSRLGRRELARRVAVVPQQPVVPPGITVQDYVLLGRTPYIGYLGTESSHDLGVAGEVSTRLDLGGLAARELAQLSGGELQRAVLARALSQQAPVLLLDEPTSALDVGHAQRVLELVDGLRREHGLTVLSAMHDLTVAGQFADRLLLLAGGRAMACGPPRTVLTEPAIAEHYAARVRVLHLADGVAVLPARHRTPVAATPTAPLSEG